MTSHPTPIRSGGRLSLSVLLLPFLAATLFAQGNPQPANDSGASTATPKQKTTAESLPTPEEVEQLSPFTVSTTKDSGYFAANTLAGSRMNTNLADLASSISVVTKQEMEDTGSTDINDVFRYEVNTEGSLTYTPGTQSMRNDGVLDVNAGGTQGNNTTPYTNAQANRVRGLGSPSSAINYYPSIAAVPFDSYNTQTVEISRGPNSMLFGLGSPAGIVNQSTAQAQLNKRSAQVSLRTDQYGSFRSSINFNQGLIPDKLAIYGAALYDDRRFDRKPAYDKTKRYYGAVTYKPFKTTTLRVNAEKYDNNNRRPNTLTPRDYVTQWNLAGQPYYDPITKKIYSLKSGQELGMRINDAASPYANDLRTFIEARPGFDPSKWNAAKTQYNGINIFGNNSWAVPADWVAGTPSPNILFVPGIGEANQGRSIMQIANSQLVNWFQPTWQYKYLPNFGTPANPAANPSTGPTNAAIYANPAWADIYTRTYTSSAPWTAAGNGIAAASYRYPGVTDQSIYDWRKVNINSMNFGYQENTNYNVEFEQELPADLFLSAGWFRQDFFQRTNYTVAQLNVATLFVDTNKNLPDGTPNPYFGKPYLEDQDPDSYINGEIDDHYRAMLAWTPDFRQKSGWLKWLGHHQVLGLWSKDNYLSTTIRQRLAYLNSATDGGRFRYLQNPNNNADGSPTGWKHFPSNNSTLRRTYYLAAPGDPNGVVTQAAGTWNPLNYTGNITAYDYDTSSFQSFNVKTGFDDIDAGTVRNQRVVDSISGGITSYFWGDRLITTFGVRQDKYKARVTNTGTTAIKDAAGNVIAPAITNAQKWVNGEFQRDFLLNRWGPYNELTGTTRTLGGVVRPFKGWDSIETSANNGSEWWRFVRSVGFSYNQSDNFNPPPQALGDFYGNPLPKPSGEGKDYGVQFTLLQDKLFARVTWFKASNLNENIAAPVVFGRLSSNVDQTLFRNWARTIALINMGKDPTADGFGTNLSTADENAVQAAAEKIWKIPYNYYESRPYTIGATRNAEAKGLEAEINYNPTRDWTMKFTFGKQDTKYASVLKEFQPWAADRQAVWAAAKASDYLLPQYQNLATYTTSGGRQVDLTNFLTSYGYNSSVFPEAANAYANPQAYYAGVVAPQLALDSDLQGQSVQGQRKYRWSFLTNYNFTDGFLRGFTVGGNERWESKAVIGYYGKASGVNKYAGQPVMDISDVTRPIYDSPNYYTDLWISYRHPILNGKVGMKIQLNVSNVFENGGLRPVAVNYDGSPYAFRIVDPRQFMLTTTFDF
ncbi:TonB-dependent receptor plug domain-containing protein [Horticoccus luteus]|uniref:TonB-dependent receptor plug domain-containing protein n=1 Tax=Horticoccus luteus TaxID=2862869 RepID=A0A8F9TTY8_9BACT|nr:TonB-dependent receptor plug domain-containing protein [Horticoccus luteus]QYM77733.1 TonB-dependent receptor plug domain-containing protein [Horticoccus luteus]